MEMSNLKLEVEVVSARDLLPKDGQGSASAFVELRFDHQNSQTTTRENDVNPVWNESFYFNISDPKHLSSLTLEATVYHHNKPNSKSFLGKVCLPGTSFVPCSDAVVLQYYPLQKRSILNLRVKGELGLKVSVTDHRDHLLRNPNQPQQQQNTPSATTRPTAPKVVPDKNSGTTSSSKPYGYVPKKTSPCLGGGPIVRGRFIAEKQVSQYDFVETMHYLFVQIVKVRHLPLENITGSYYVSLKIGYYNGNTKPSENMHNPEWNQVFAIKMEHLQSPVMDVVVKHYNPENNNDGDQFEGSLQFNIHEVHRRVPPDSPLAPKWYEIADNNGDKKGELMLAVWKGTQADEAFPDAWHSDSRLPANVSSVTYGQIRSKVYHTPRLWYARVNVIEAQDLFVSGMSGVLDAYAKLQIGNQCLKTKTADSEGPNPIWNEEIIFVAAEPFDEEYLIVSLEYGIGPEKYESFGSVSIALNAVERYEDDRTICGQWFNLEKSMSADVMENDTNKSSASRIHLSVCVDGGYNVLDEPTKQRGKPIGVLEVGVISAGKLLPTKTRKGRATSDPYCVAKYGDIWFRTRTIIDSLNPKYNEQHTWDVYDPATVLTVAIFDDQIDGNSNGNKDVEIGKVRIPISTLESGRIYTLLYPLISLSSSGVNKMGELHVAVRFSCTSFINMIFKYSQPLGHFKVCEQAVSTVAAHLGRAEPPLKKEVVQCMYSEVVSDVWSLRRSKANFFRVMSILSGLIAVGKWFGEVCMWKNPITTTLVHLLFVMLVCTPELIFPTVFLYMFVIGAWNFRYRPRFPPYTDIRISCATIVHPDELDEEFDTYPTSRDSMLIMMRYDRLRTIAGRLQKVLGDIVVHGERIQELLSWRDPRITTLFITFCLVSAIILCVTPLKVLVILVGVYFMRHPWFRSKTQSTLLNVFERLPDKTDCMLPVAYGDFFL